MAADTASTDLDLPELLESFTISLRAARRSEATVKAYRLGTTQYLRWCDDHGLPRSVDRAQVRNWMVSLQEGGAAPATVASRLAGVRQLSKWLTEEELLDADPLLRLNAPEPDIPITPVLTEEQLRALFKACQGGQLRDRRDEAIVRLMAETGLRVSEALGLDVGDIDLPRGLAYIRRGKGGKGRIVPFGPQTARALDRYIRLRRPTRPRICPALFVTARRPLRLADHGLRRTLGARAEAAGIDKFHPHMLRHTAASRWLASGGSEGGLMAVAGWSSREHCSPLRAGNRRRACRGRGARPQPGGSVMDELSFETFLAHADDIRAQVNSILAVKELRRNLRVVEVYDRTPAPCWPRCCALAFALAVKVDVRRGRSAGQDARLSRDEECIGVVGGPSCSGRLISRRERQAFVCAVMAAQGERAAS